MISVRNLKKVYGQGPAAVHALKNIDLEVKANEFVAIMGRSGSGKSTLLHLIGLIDTPTAGDIRIDGLDISRLSEGQKTRLRLKKMGYVFQEYSLIGELTLLENVCLPAMSMSGQNGDHYRKRAEEALCMVGLEKRQRHYPHETSGGEQQRAAIARAIINQPRILFADEPTASLDAVSSKTVLELFKKLNKELGQTIVMVTHEPEDRRYVDRIIWLKDGSIDTAIPAGS